MASQVIVTTLRELGNVVDVVFATHPEIADIYWNFCFDQVWWRFM